jgi:cellulose synthase operon protein C
MLSHLKSSVSVFALFLICAPVFARADDNASASSSPKSPSIVALDEGPDESGLRYYAAQGLTARVSKEIQRLRRLYPSWNPPENIMDKVGDSVDEEAFWELYSEDRIDELRLAINARETAEPGWHPSNDLMTKLQSKELRRRVMQYWKDGKWQNLVDYVKANKFSGDSGDVELVWTLAEAHARIKQNKDAAAIYKSILVSNVGAAQRQATLQKAMAFLRINDIEPLIAVARPADVDLVRLDLTRMRISAFLHDEESMPVTPRDMNDFQTYARSSDDANQPGLIAWYFFKRHEYSNSLEWFKMALERNGDAMVAHGLALALIQVGQRREAEEVAYAWRAPLINNSILFIDILERDLVQPHPIFVEPERLARFAQVTIETTSGQGAQALAWYAYNSCQFTVALDWFQRAVAWYPKEATILGYALTLRRLKMRKEYFDLVNRYDGLFPKLVGLVFPDGNVGPPSACDVEVSKTPADTANQQYSQMLAARNVRMPQVLTVNAYAQAPTMPVLNKNEFPISVSPDNPLRYFPPFVLDPHVNVGFVLEPIAGPWSLVARRVNGVGAMPYEKWGYSLLPSWSGSITPSAVIAAEQVAPAGTQWSLEMQNGDVPVTNSGVSSQVNLLVSSGPQPTVDHATSTQVYRGN